MYITLEPLHEKQATTETIEERAAHVAGGTTVQPKQIQHKRTSTHCGHFISEELNSYNTLLGTLHRR